MKATSKFLFDVDFAPGAEARAKAQAQAQAQAEPVIALAEHMAKLQAADAEGYRKGMAAAEAQAKAEAERRTAGALEAISRGLDALGGGLQGIEQRLEAEAVDVAVAIARKLAPELIAQEPLAEIEALAADCFRQLVRAPHVVVRLNDAVYDMAREKLDILARQRGFDGRLVILGEPDIALGDCRIEWADGGITRERAVADTAISEAVKRYISARQSGG